MSERRPDTWMPLYVADYLADTTRLSTVQHGAYLLLIMAYWRAGEALLDDDDELAAMTRLPLKDWRRVRDKIAAFFTVSAGTWTHHRIERELVRAADNREQRSAAGRASATQRAKQRSVNERSTGVDTDAPTNGQQKGNSSSSPSPVEDSEAKASGADAPPAPPSEQDLVWGDGLDWLASAEGKPKAPLRSMIGRWCKVYGDGHVLAAMSEARSTSPPIVGPVAWIEAALKARNRGNGNQHRGKTGNPFVALAVEGAQRRAGGPA